MTFYVSTAELCNTFNLTNQISIGVYSSAKIPRLHSSLTEQTLNNGTLEFIFQS